MKGRRRTEEPAIERGGSAEDLHHLRRVALPHDLTPEKELK